MFWSWRKGERSISCEGELIGRTYNNISLIPLFLTAFLFLWCTCRKVLVTSQLKLFFSIVSLLHFFISREHTFQKKGAIDETKMSHDHFSYSYSSSFFSITVLLKGLYSLNKSQRQ